MVVSCVGYVILILNYLVIIQCYPILLGYAYEILPISTSAIITVVLFVGLILESVFYSRIIRGMNVLLKYIIIGIAIYVCICVILNNLSVAIMPNVGVFLNVGGLIHCFVVMITLFPVFLGAIINKVKKWSIK